MINRIVLFQFKPTVALERIDRVMEMPQKWLGAIPALAEMKVIRNTQPASSSKYLYGFVMAFRESGDIEVFSNHELHKEFVEALSQIAEDVQVFDY